MLTRAIFKLKRLFLPGTMNAIAQLQSENQRLLERLASLEQQSTDTERVIANRVGAVTGNLIRRASPEAFFDCEFNGARVLLPRDTLRTMTHCIHPPVDGPLLVLAETFHTEWLKNKLRPGDLFLDVGASTGAMTVPIARSLSNVRVIAFEPNRNTRRVLEDTLAKNQIGGVEVQGAAVSDQVGALTFVELPHDPTGLNPFMPEASSLLTDALKQSTIGTSYEAPVTTLDAFFEKRTDEAKVRAIKIDVEGFEIHVLRGATRLLAAAKPYLAIDIHGNPFAPGTTEAGCRSVLTPFGFAFEKQGHVLLCSPTKK